MFKFKVIMSFVLVGIILFTINLKKQSSKQIGVKTVIDTENVIPAPEHFYNNVPLQELVDPAKTIGDQNAPLSVIIFGDFWCPACRISLLSLLKFRSVNPNGIKIIIRHLPLWQLPGHETSRAAAALSEMAAEKNMFSAFVDSLHLHPAQPGEEEYLSLMQNLGFSRNEVFERLNNPKDPSILKVLRDEELSQKLGFNQTPSFIVFGDKIPPVYADVETLLEILNSTEVKEELLSAATKKRIE
jgi:protein-disulfide isomerase